MRSSLHRPLAIGVAALCLAALAFAAVAQRAAAVTANQDAYHVLYKNEDGFRNWDFQCGTPGGNCIRRDNVDWPIGMVYTNDASIGGVKNILSGQFSFGATCADPMYARMQDDSVNGFAWDEDSGVKTACCTFWGGVDQHTRIYSAGTQYGHDEMYNTAWGFWVMASAHYDISECAGHTQFGYSEDVEHKIYLYWKNTLGLTGYYDYVHFNFYNSQFGWQKNHYVENDGYASKLVVP
jgi:hypothetical protein